MSGKPLRWVSRSRFTPASSGAESINIFGVGGAHMPLVGEAVWMFACVPFDVSECVPFEIMADAPFEVWDFTPFVDSSSISLALAGANSLEILECVPFEISRCIST